jgi:hypothetical protein
MRNTSAVLVFDGFADWEPAFALTGLRRWGRRPAVTDRGVISASGIGAVEFAREIFAALHVLSADDLRLFVQMYRNGRHTP